MKNSLKVVFIILMAFLVCFSLISCNKSTEKSKVDVENKESGGENEVKEEEKENVNLRFTYWGSPNEKAAIESACAKFTENYPWITVEPMQIPNADYNTKLKAMAAGNDMPDTGYMTGDLGEEWANVGKFVNLFEMFEKDDELSKDDFLDYIWYKISPDNAWGISTAGECFGLYYNKDCLKEAGIESLPTTAADAMNWDKFVELAKKLTIDNSGKTASEEGFDPNNIKQYGFLFETWLEPINNFIFSNGGKWVSDDGKEFTFNSPETMDAVQKLSDLIHVHHVSPTILKAKTLPAMNQALESKAVAMAVGGQWINLDLGNANVNYDIGVLPKLKNSVTIGLSGATVFFKDSKNPDEAWMLFKWMANPEGAIKLYSDGLWMPTLKEWYSNPDLVKKWVDANPAAHPSGFKESMMEQFMENGVPQPQYYLKNVSNIYPVITSALEEVWIGKKTPSEALIEIDEKVKPEFQGRYDVN